MPHWIVPVVVSIHGLLKQLVPSRLVYLFIMPQRRDGRRRIPRKPLEHALGFFRALWNFVVCHVLREMLVLIWRLVLLISLGIYKTLCLKILFCTSTFLERIFYFRLSPKKALNRNLTKRTWLIIGKLALWHLLDKSHPLKREWRKEKSYFKKQTTKVFKRRKLFVESPQWPSVVWVHPNQFVGGITLLIHTIAFNFI